MTELPDLFARLGLPRRFALDPAELERQYLARSRAVHPDYHASSTGDLSASLELSSGLNEAYTTLRDPFTRAEYLLRMSAGPPGADERHTPAGFLAEMLDIREQIEEARSDRTRRDERVSLLAVEFDARLNQIVDEMGRLFEESDRVPLSHPQRQMVLQKIRGLLNSAQYVRGLRRDLLAD